MNMFMSQFKHKAEQSFDDSMRLSVQVMPQLMDTEIKNKDARTTWGFFQLKPMDWYKIHKTSAHPIKVGNYVVPYTGPSNNRPRDPRAEELIKSDSAKFTKDYFRRR